MNFSLLLMLIPVKVLCIVLRRHDSLSLLPRISLLHKWSFACLVSILNVLNSTSKLWTTARNIASVKDLLVEPNDVEFVVELRRCTRLRSQNLRLQHLILDLLSSTCQALVLVVVLQTFVQG